MVFKGVAKVRSLRSAGLFARGRPRPRRQGIACRECEIGLIGGSFDLTFDGSLTDARIGTDAASTGCWPAKRA
jgi:hypothetical protein